MAKIEDIPLKRLHADCSRITLTRGGERPVSWSGPGMLRQNEHGTLVFEMRADRDVYSAAFRDLNRRVVVGEVIPESEYFQIRLEEMGGGAWEGTVPVIAHRGNFTEGFLEGMVQELVQEQNLPANLEQRDYATLWIERQIEFPRLEMTRTQKHRGDRLVGGGSRRDYTDFRAGTEEFTLVDHETHTLLECTLDSGGISRFRHVRMIEALQFALGQLLHPCACFLQTSGKRITKIRSLMAHDRRFAVDPPLAFDPTPIEAAVFPIASAYYTALSGYVDEDWHSVSCRVYQLLEAGAAPIELKGLAYAVATEGVIGECFPLLGESTSEFNRNDSIEDGFSKGFHG